MLDSFKHHTICPLVASDRLNLTETWRVSCDGIGVPFRWTEATKPKSDHKNKNSVSFTDELGYNVGVMAEPNVEIESEHTVNRDSTCTRWRWRFVGGEWSSWVPSESVVKEEIEAAFNKRKTLESEDPGGSGGR